MTQLWLSGDKMTQLDYFPPMTAIRKTIMFIGILTEIDNLWDHTTNEEALSI